MPDLSLLDEGIWSNEGFWAFIFSREHDHFNLPKLFDHPIMRRVMAQIRQITEKEAMLQQDLSQKLYESDQATLKSVHDKELNDLKSKLAQKDSELAQMAKEIARLKGTD